MTMTRLWNMIGAVSVLLILLLGYVIGVSPALASASTSDEELASVEMQNQVKLTELDALKAMAKDSDQLFADLAEAQLAIPGSHKSSEFARQLAELATAAGVQLQEVSYLAATDAISPEEAPPAVPAEPDGEPSVENGDNGDAEVPPQAPAGPQSVASVPGLISVGVSLKVVGPIAAVTKFLSFVQLDQRVFSVSSTELRVGSEPSLFELSLDGSVYVLAASSAPVASTVDSGVDAN